MSGVNKVIILGNLGQDPEVKFMPSGEAVANISIATSESWKDKQTGEQKEKTEWHRVVMFGKLAEITGEYLKKGSKVLAFSSRRHRSKAVLQIINSKHRETQTDLLRHKVGFSSKQHHSKRHITHKTIHRLFN